MTASDRGPGCGPRQEEGCSQSLLLLLLGRDHTFHKANPQATRGETARNFQKLDGFWKLKSPLCNTEHVPWVVKRGRVLLGQKDVSEEGVSSKQEIHVNC